LKRLIILILIGICLFAETKDGIAFANNPQKTTPYYEDHSKRVGYKSVDEAVKEFEKYCNCVVKLPTMILDEQFTHEFGAVYKDKKNSENIQLQIRFVNREMRNNILKIDIHTNPSDYEGNIYPLNNEQTGIYSEQNTFSVFVFEKNNLQYVVSIDKELTNLHSPQLLIDIANSIE